MTGQVKEEILTRFGELGLRVVGARVAMAPGLLPASAVLAYGEKAPVARFTFCGVEISVSPGDVDEYRVRRAGAWEDPVPGRVLELSTSREVLRRTGAVEAVRFSVAGGRSIALLGSV